MRINAILVILLSLLLSCNRNNNQNINGNLINNPASGSGKVDPSKVPVIKFEKMSHDFGSVREGEVVTYSFKFQNTGKTNLIIANVIASCGCTVPTYPKKPIPPGKSEYIDVQFNSSGRSGSFKKEVTVYANTIPNTTEVTINGVIIKK